MSILLGCIADDFTGATDLANTLVNEGMRTVQVIGMPSDKVDLSNADAVVVALKSRTVPVRDAVGFSLDALNWLRAQGTRQFFFKYCSTFDSTSKGNIGPVANALLDALDTNFAIVCPAFPQNRRTIYQGHLFVGNQLLCESSMKDHPLTPMRDGNLVRLMHTQSCRRVGLVDMRTVAQGPKVIANACADLSARGIPFGVVDAISENDLRAIGEAAAGHKLVTGGSGVAVGLPENFRRDGRLGEAALPETPGAEGRAIVLAGSCSKATREQIAYAKNNWPSYQINIDRLAEGAPIPERVLAWSDKQSPDSPILVYGSADPEDVARAQKTYGRERAGQLMERALGEIAQRFVERGARRLIVAGGETSGAIVSALGVKALRIGPEIEPGVPWTETLDESRLALALKSGNFGTEDFFEKALEMLS